MQTATAVAVEAATSSPCVADRSKLAASYIDVALPIRLSHKWVAYACRTAGVAKPKWNRDLSVWTTSLVADDGTTETITLTSSQDARMIRIQTESTCVEGVARESSATRRLASAFVTTMREGVRRRTEMRETYAELRRVAARSRPADPMRS
jgi:hypothetical protein